jgi:c-di-GMP-binding flagellar brake protein YcgR
MRPAGRGVDVAGDNVLQIGQLAQLTEQGEGRVLAGRLAAIGASTFEVTASVEAASPPIDVRAGDRLLVKLFTSSGVYSFESAVVESSGAGYVLRKPKQVDRIQRREFLRIPEALSVRFVYRTTPFHAREVRCTSVDISGGGLRLRPEAPLMRPPKIGAHADISFALAPGEPTISCKSRIVRYQDEGAQLSVQFLLLEEKDRARLVRFVNARHAELQRRAGA